MPAGISRLSRRVLLLLCLPLATGAGGADEPVEGLGCPQLQLSRETPELVLDERLRISADEVLMEEGGLSNLAGMVKLRQGDKVFSADALSFDDATRVVTVKTESLFRSSDVTVKSREARFDLNAESGVFLDTEFNLPSRSARGSADRVELLGSGELKLAEASYTTCGPHSDAWYVEASKIELDHEQGLGSARHARLRFMGVPILYMPWFQFPIDDRRRTGLLYPTIGQLSGSGLDLRWPVYLNLAPNYDATYTPRLLSERGLQSGLEGRYLLGPQWGEGDARFEYLDDRKHQDQRTLFRVNHRGLINRRLAVEATYAEASDGTYFEDLGGSLYSASTTHLEQTARFTYQAPASYKITTLVQNFQPLASNLTATDPYKRLPQVRFESLTRRSMFHTRAGIDAEAVNFARDQSAEGGRLLLNPYLQFERQAASWYFLSQADLHHTRYELSGALGGSPETPERTLPIVSAESGLRFERITDDGHLQTLTPRGFALYVPYEKQDELPLFDTGEPDFDFVQLFARNRFSGEDRLADAQHVAGAATLRELDPESGESLWSASIGQLYRIDAPRVGLPGLVPPERGATEFIGQFDYRLLQNWRTVVAAQWSPESSQFERTQFGLRYREPSRRHQLDLTYRYRRDLLEQADLSFLTPIGGAWQFAARTRYALDDHQSRENFVGVEYGTCCWALRASYRRFIGDASGDFDSGIYLQLQLKGLASLGAGGKRLLADDEIGGKATD